MKKNLLVNILVIGVIILFFGASIMSSVSGDIKNVADIENGSYFRNKGLRSDMMERMNYFRGKVLKSNLLENPAQNLFGYLDGWTPSELVSSESTGNSTWCSIAVNASGAIHVVWQDVTDYGGSGNDTDIFYKMKPSGGSWTTTKVVSSESSIESDAASLAVESDGTVHVTWDDYTETTCDVYYKMKPSGGSWTTAELVTGDCTGYPFLPSLDVESDESVHIAWEEWDGGYIFDIYYKMKPSGGSWTAAEAVTQTSTESFSPSLIVDQDGNVHVTWVELSLYDFLDVCYKKKPDGGTWSSTDILSSNSYCMIRSEITVDSSGTVHVVFDELDLNSFYLHVFYRKKPSGGSWSPIEMVTDDFVGDSYGASVDVDQSGVVHVAWEGWPWERGKSDYIGDIYYKNNDYENLPPEAPTIDGPTSGKKGTEYHYNFTANDPNGNNVYYFIDWGDNTTEGWIGPYASNEIITWNHTWNERGTYTIKAKAKDIYDAESNWTTLKVTIPKSQIYNWWMNWLDRFPLLQWLIDVIGNIQTS